MASCKYILKGHTFNSETELDDFIVSKEKYRSKYGDLVFEKTEAELDADTIIEKMKNETKTVTSSNPVEIQYEEDGEPITIMRRPYMGVNRFFGEISTENNIVVPKFLKENYWANRTGIWTGEVKNPRGVGRSLNIFYDDDKDQGVFTREECKLIFGTDDLTQITPTFLNKEQSTQWRIIIENKWSYQGQSGTAWHNIMEIYWSKDSDGKYMFEKYPSADEFAQYLIDNRAKYKDGYGGILLDEHKHPIKDLNGNEQPLLTDDIIKQSAQTAIKIHENIIATLPTGTKLNFYPELGVTQKINEVPGNDALKGITNLYGIIDLLVVDENGKSYIFDYKTSPKVYDDYSSSKKLAFQYQLAMYRQVLKSWGLKVPDDGLEEFIIPVQLENLSVQNREELAQVANAGQQIDPRQIKFGFSAVKFDKIENITSNIKTARNILPTIEEYLPTPPIIGNVTSGNALQLHEKFDQGYFPTQKIKEQRTRETVVKELRDAGAFTITRNNLYEYKVAEDKNIQATTEEDLISKVLKYYTVLDNWNSSRAEVIQQALIAGQSSDIEEMNSTLENVNKDPNKFLGADINWFRNILGRYAQPKYEVIHNDAGISLGIILVRNKINNQIEVIRITGRDPRIQHYFTDENGKQIKNRSNLSYAFETDIIEDSNKQSLMLKATTGNIEAMEALAFVNNIADSLQGCTIGRISVINPVKGLGNPVRNHELMYCWNKLHKLKQIDGMTDNISNGKLKLASDADIAINDFKDAMNQDYEGFKLNHKQYESAQNDLNTAVDNSAKVRALMKILNELKSAQIKSDSDLNNSNFKDFLYNEITLAITELNGIELRQQLQDHDSWVQDRSFGGILTKGLSGNLQDNPGQLNSKALNTLTDLVTQGYQNVRDDMQKEVVKMRSLVEKLKKRMGYSWMQSRLIGNEISIFKNMTYMSSTGDLMFVDPTKATLFPEEKEFLEYALTTINKHRYPNMDIEQMKQDGDPRYFRVPLAKGSFQSDVAVMGLGRSLLNRLRRFTPKAAMQELREKSEGIFGEDTERTDNDLFELNTKFDRFETDADYRKQTLTKFGEGYFEHNLETLVLEHSFAYISKYHINNIMPMIRGVMTFLTVSGKEGLNKEFTQDLEYAQNYIKAVIKNQPLAKNISEEKTKAEINKIKSAASFAALAFSPVQFLYQTIQGFWQDISLCIRKPDGTDAFTIKHFTQAFKYVYKDLAHYSDEPTKIQLLNEKFGMNDMDMNTYIDHIKSDHCGIFNINNFAYKFTSRPDYYNRMTILVAKMIADGSWDAYSVVDGKLVYDWKKDKRYNLLANPNADKTSQEYQYQKAFYYANAKQFEEEGRANPDGSKYTMYKENSQELNDIPDAYTTQEMESAKSLSDLIYGYYSHEKKSLIHYTFIGSLLMQMKTFWSGKKNQYLQRGGVYVRGNWEQYEENGQKYYYQVDNNGLAKLEEPPVTEDQLKPTDIRIPFVKWRGQWQEGIIATLSDVVHQAYIDADNSVLKTFVKIPKALKDKLTDQEHDIMLRKVYKANLSQFLIDIVAYFMIGGLVGGILLGSWAKELEKEAKESHTFSDGLKASAADILTMSVTNSAADFAWWSSIGNPVTQWTPFAFETVGRFISNAKNSFFGDKTFYGGLINTFSTTKIFKPALETLYPINEQDDNQ